MAKAAKFIPCTLRLLPKGKRLKAAAVAAAINPANQPATFGLAALDPQRLAVLTTKYWGSGGVRLSVAFLDNAPADLRRRILSHMNAWGAFANVEFAETAGAGDVRIARAPGEGYYSYLGTDIRLISKHLPTMNLAGFTTNTPEAEFTRVVRHETGHTLGFPHEHLWKELVARLDERKTLAYFRQQYGWDEDDTRWNVLTPLGENSILASPDADEASVMTYRLPGAITKDGRPIAGGADFSPADRAFAAKLYPPPAPPPPPPPPPPPAPAEFTVTTPGTYRLVQK